MATFSLLNIIVIILIIYTSNTESLGSSFLPRVSRIISRPDSDFDDIDFDFDNDLPIPFSRFPMGPGPIAPIPLMNNPLLGGIGGSLGFNPLTRLFPNPYQRQSPYFNGLGMRPQRQEEIYTAIGYDKMDPSSQMRLTITKRRPQGSGMVNPILGGPLFPGMELDDDFSMNHDAPDSWYVQGAFLGSQIKNKAGTYYLVVTESGRTADGCFSESLGRIVSHDIVDINNPFTQEPSGVVANPVLVGSGGSTVYASTLEGVSRRQLIGAGIAACQYINNGVCGGYIPFCATITKDILPAMEVPLPTNSAPTRVTFDPFGSFGLQQGGALQGGDSGLLSFAEEDRSAGFNSPVPLARQEQQTGSNNALGLLF